MKKLLLLVLIAFSCLTKAQTNPLGNYTPGGAFDTLYSNYGSKHALKDILIDTNTYIKGGSSYKAASLLCTSAGYFNVYFETGSGMEGTSTTDINRRNVICQLLTDISAFIQPANSTVRVNIWVRNINNIVPNASTSGVLGLATSYYALPLGAPSFGGIADNEIWKTINSGTDSYTNLVSPLTTGTTTLSTSGQYFHGYMAFNFTNPSFNWNTDLTVLNPSGYFDLYSIALHEMTHALGFASLIYYDGTSKFGPSASYYSRYDLFLKEHTATNSLISNSGGCSMYQYTFNPAISAGAVNTISPSGLAGCGGTLPATGSSDNTICSTDLLYTGGSYTVPLYTPNCYETPSSLSHFEDQCYPTPASPYGNNLYFTMSNANGMGPGFTKRYLKKEERSVLCDLGYYVNTTYGNSLDTANSHSYGGSACPGNQVVGIDDGITPGGSYSFTGAISTAIPITGILSNDYPSTGLTFECMQVIIGAGTLSATSGTSCNYTPTTGGLHVLRYVPVTSGGTRGNITYVYVYVLSAGCTPSSCDIINNGGFESAPNCGQMNSYADIPNPVPDCWSVFAATPDQYKRGCVAASYSPIQIPTPNCYPSADTWDSPSVTNNGMIALWSFPVGSYAGNEAIQNTTSSPIAAGGAYVLSFVARVANGFASNQTNTLIFGGSPSTMASLGSGINAVPAGVTTFTSAVVPNDNMWHSYAITFTNTASVNLNNFIIMGGSFTYTTSINSYVFLDDVSLLPITAAPSFTLPATICVGSSISDLSSYAVPPGGVFSGPGVSYSGGLYSFHPTSANAGNAVIAYTYTNSGTGCAKTISANINVQGAGITGPTTPVCSGTPVTLIGNGLSTYTWSTGNTTQTINVTLFSTTTLSVTGVAAGGCPSTAYFTVYVNPTPSIFEYPSNPTICAGQTTTLTAGGGTTYTWNPGTGLSSTTGSTVTASPTVTTAYQVSSINSYSCTGYTFFTITVNPIPTPTLVAGPTTICPGNTSTLTASGLTTYSWTPSTALSCTNCANPAATPTTTTTYTVSGVNSNGCLGTGIITLTVTPLPTLTLTATPNPVCSNQSSGLNASGASTYTWMPSSSLSCSVCASPSANPGTPTIYTVTGTDVNGCVGTNTLTLNVNPAPVISVSVSPASVCVGQSATLTASGATSYTWSTGATTPAISGTVNVAGLKSYTVTGTNSYGCVSALVYTVYVNPLPTLTVVASPPIICSGASTLTASGASTYTWSSNAGSVTTSTAVVTPLFTNTYTVSGTSASGCSASNTVSVVVASPPTISLGGGKGSGFSSTICTGTSTTITAMGASTYSWSPSSSLSSSTGTSVVASPTITTTYSVVGTATTGCTATATVTITVQTSTCTGTPPPTYSPTANYTLTSNPAYISSNLYIPAHVNYVLSSPEIRMAPGVSINVAPNGTLTVQGSWLHSCSSCTGALWTGIVVQNGGTVNMITGTVTSGTVVVTTTNIIEDADAAMATVYSATNTAVPTWSLTSTIFNNNDMGIYVDYNNASLSSNSISNCVFTTRRLSNHSLSLSNFNSIVADIKASTPSILSTTNPLDYTLDNHQCLYGVYTNGLNPSYPLMIGIPSAASNLFDNVGFGVYANSGSYTIKNNIFQNLTGSSTGGITNGSGIGVYAYQNVMQGTATVTVGNSSLTIDNTEKNYFTNCLAGVVTQQQNRVNINNNNFSNESTSSASSFTSTTNAFGQYAVYQSGFAAFSSTVTPEQMLFANNTVKNYSYGHYFDFGKIYNTNYPSISFYNNAISAVGTSTAYCNTGIYLQQSGTWGCGSGVTQNAVSVSTNSITNVAINAVSVSAINTATATSGFLLIDGNTELSVQYNSAATTTVSPHIAAVYVSGSNHVKVSNNPKIQCTSLTSYSTTNAQYIAGVYIATSPSSSVSCNTINYVGEDFVWEGASPSSQWYKNKMQHSRYGLVLRNSGVMGDQGGSGRPIGDVFNKYVSTDITDAHTLADNSNPGGAATSKLYCLAAACTATSTPLPCQNAYAGTGIPYAATVTTFSTTGSLPCACTGDCGGLRMAQNNSVYADSATMARDSMLMNMVNSIENGDPFPVYDMQTRWALQYYVSSQNSSLNPATGYENAQAFAAVDGAISGSNYGLAQTILSAITPNNTVENNWQLVDNLTIKLQSDSLDSADVAALKGVAIQCPLTGGNIVYTARALLNNNLKRAITYADNCIDNGDNNRTASINNTIIDKSSTVTVYPNPNNGSMTFAYKIKDDARLEISDLSGRLVGTYLLPAANNRFDVKNEYLKDGVYFYRVMDSKNTVVKIGKIIIIQ
jgi:hypothetical protein